MADKDALDRSSFVRRLVLRNPSITADEAREEWDRAKMPYSSKPNIDQMRQLVSSARYTIKGKYGLKDIDDVPIKRNGDPNVSELLRLLMKKHTNLSEEQARYYLRVDGLTFTPALWAQVRRRLAENQPQPKEEPKALPYTPPQGGALVPLSEINKAQEESPDANQNKGPRARFKGKPGRKPKSHTAASPRADSKKAEEYLSIEQELDELLHRARNMLDSSLAAKIRAARNHTIVEASKLA